MSKVTLSRRTFLKVSGIMGAAAGIAATTGGAALAESSVAAEKQGDVTRIRSCCRACGKNECGVWAIVKDGKVIRTEGDESAFHSMGNHCSKGQASLQAAYHPDRVKYPMKRTNPKGDKDPGWVRISWDEALSTACQKLNEIKDKEGGQSILLMCGTSRIWSMACYRAFNQLFDTPNSLLGWQICKGPRAFATALQSEFCTYWMETGGRPEVHVTWGGASEISNYDESGRTTVDIAKNAKDYIVCDPRMTGLGHEATVYQQMTPGTDGALALAWIYTIIEDGKGLDMPYIKRWTDSPYLVVDGMEPSGGTPLAFKGATSSEFNLKTRLLKECDLVEGGSPQRWMVYDALAGTDEAHPEHKYGKLTYYDAETGLWEDEPADREVEFYTCPQQNIPFAAGRVAKIQSFLPEIDPALEGEYEVTLKDGTKHKMKPVWQLLKEHVADYTPEKVADTVGISADNIRKAALTYAHRIPHDDGRDYGNGGIQYMLALEHATNAIQNNRLMDLISGITGNIDTPAGNRGATVGTLTCDGQTMLASGYVPEGKFKDWPKYRLGGEQFPLLNWWQFWADAHTAWQAVLTGKPYRPKAAICESGDHMVMANSLESYEALSQLDFFLILDLWQTPTASMADIFMPVNHWLETNSPRISQGATGAQGATVKAMDAPGECRPDMEIVFDMYRYSGKPWISPGTTLQEAMTYGTIAPQIIAGGQLMKLESDGIPTLESYLDYTVATSPGGGTWKNYVKNFQENGWWDCHVINPEEWGTYRRFETGVLRADKMKGFSTPTHKQEYWNTTIESVMPDSGMELPTWKPAPRTELANPDIVKDYPFLMTTGRRIPVYFHSEHRQLPWCRELWPVPRIEINPEDAKRLGIQQGDWVWVESNKSKIRQCADLYYGVKPGIINCEHQWWFPELDQGDHGFQLSGINCLVDGENRDPICGASNLRAYNVNIYKATPENSPFGNPCPCGDDGTPIIADATDPRLKTWNRSILDVRDGKAKEE